MAEFDYWGLLAGIGLFLFAMLQMESALKTLASRSIASYLKGQAEHPLKAAFGGIVATALLQSSSIVGLMVLAFVGAGLLSLPAALGVIFGSNLGTTLTGWIVTSLGFKVELFDLALPLVAVGAFVHVFGRGRWSEIGRAILGLALLLLGLQLMKSSVASLETLIDVADLAELAPWQYLIFGLVVAAVIQSSSATMMITLAALHGGIIDLPNAAAVVIGADLGTTTTVLLGAAKGSVPKRQVAVGHVLFNVATDSIAYVLRIPLLALIAFAGISDPLYSLVAFHSLFNLLGMLLFLPLTQPFARLLERLIRADAVHEARYLKEVGPGVSAAALHAVAKESSRLIARVIRLQMVAFEPVIREIDGRLPVPYGQESELGKNKDFATIYAASKKLEGEILDFSIRLQEEPLNETDSARLTSLMGSVRQAMHAAKAIKDIRHNLAELRESSGPSSTDYFRRFSGVMIAFLQRLFQLRQDDASPVAFADLVSLLQRIYAWHEKMHDEIYSDVRSDRVDENVVSTLLNVNREVLNACLSLVYAVGDYYLEPAQAETLERLPAGDFATIQSELE